MGNVLELKGIEKTYFGAVDTKVLHGIDLAFEEGSFNSIIGQSGSGKSTLLNIIGTLDKPTKGLVFVDGQDTSKMGKMKLAKLRNQTIGFVFQFHYLLPEFTALENILMPIQISGKRVDGKTKAKAEELCELVGISEVRNNNSTKMSGGQQQRCAIARALMNQPKIILADEPTGNLDSDTTAQIYSLFRDVNAKLKTTFIIVTHDRRIAEEADRIVEIKDGRVFLDIKR